MMNGRGKSDSAIVAERPTNKAGRPAEEPEERRAKAEGMRYSKARTGLRTGKACPRRWIAYDKQQDRERRTSSPRSYTTSARFNMLASRFWGITSSTDNAS
jgi:hypothetical protein